MTKYHHNVTLIDATDTIQTSEHIRFNCVFVACVYVIVSC